MKGRFFAALGRRRGGRRVRILEMRLRILVGRRSLFVARGNCAGRRGFGYVVSGRELAELEFEGQL